MQIKGETREGRKQMTPISKHSEDQNMTKDIRLEGNQKQKKQKTRGSAEINISSHTLTHAHKYTLLLLCTHARAHKDTHLSVHAPDVVLRGERGRCWRRYGPDCYRAL